MSDLLHAIATAHLARTLEIRTLPTPAVGAELIIPAPGGQDWRLRGVTAVLVTSAVVANRTVKAIIDDQTNQGIVLPTGNTQAASTITTYSWVNGLSFAPATPTAGFLALTLPDVILPTGWRFRTSTGLLDVGDSWITPTVLIERLDEPPWREPMVGTEYEALVHEALQAEREGMQ